MTTRMMKLVMLGWLVAAAGCGQGTADSSEKNSQDSLTDSEADPTSACEGQGGSCVAVAPGACASGRLGDAGLCGGGVGAVCCLPALAGAGSGAGAALPGVANPAAAYCVGLGYTLGANDECQFPDGTSCEHWAFYRGQCGQAHSHCNLQGGTVSSRTEDLGSFTAVYAICTLPDGAECREEDFVKTGSCQ